MMIIKNSRCICWLNETKLLIYKKGSFFEYDCLTNIKNFFCKMPVHGRNGIIVKSKLLERVFRAYPQSPVINHFTNEIYFSFMGCVYSLNILNKTIKKEIQLQHNATRTLSICISQNGAVLFGEYPTKYDGKPINIYEKKVNKSWSSVFSFPPGTIRHIHLLFTNENDLYCFTGDENSETKIVKFGDMNYSNPVLLASNSQKYRTCLAFLKNKTDIIYFSDTPYFTNKLYSFNQDYRKLTEKQKLDGTVIYGLKDGADIFFSTVVEPNLKKNSNNKNVSISINGHDGGIKTKYSTVYVFNEKEEIIPIFSLKKDLLPFKLFGLGTFVFTSNGNDKYFAFTSSGLRKNGNTFVFEKQYFYK